MGSTPATPAAALLQVMRRSRGDLGRAVPDRGRFRPARLGRPAGEGLRTFGWLVGYSSFLGPIAGIFIADYWLIRKARLSLADLYSSDGIYGRWNWKALISLVAGVAVALIGLAVPGLRILYDYAWFAGFGVAFFLYWLLMRGTPELDLKHVPPAEA